MSDETTDKIVYEASLRLASGPIVRVRVVDEEVRTSITNEVGVPVAARMTCYEADEVSDMHRAAFRICPSPYQVAQRKEAGER